MQKKTLWISIGIFLFLLFLFPIGVVLTLRIHASAENWSYFSCALSGKEQEIVNCDERAKMFTLSGDQVSFVPEQLFGAVYVPFTSDTIKLHINPETAASYEFWVVYDNFWRKELQWAWGEAIADTNPEQLEKSLKAKLNTNFFFEKDDTGQKTITIATQGPFSTQGNVGYRSLFENSFLVKGQNPKGVIMLMMMPVSGKDKKVVLTKEEINR